MSDSSAEPSQAQPDPEVLERIDRQLGQLIPEVRKLRRARWLTWGLVAVAVAGLVLAIIGWVVYRQDLSDDRAVRRELVERFEAALVAECMSSADSTADLRTAFNVLIDLAVDPSSPDELALARQLNDRLDEAVPPRDCAQEARDRSPGG